jgi:hypothetical protein
MLMYYCIQAVCNNWSMKRSLKVLLHVRNIKRLCRRNFLWHSLSFV